MRHFIFITKPSKRVSAKHRQKSLLGVGQYVALMNSTTQVNGLSPLEVKLGDDPDPEKDDEDAEGLKASSSSQQRQQLELQQQQLQLQQQQLQLQLAAAAAAATHPQTRQHPQKLHGTRRS
ncbi:hypothetical protein, conserved [Eimeria tenella]|uniref:Uncharacterized protein n=1 Tax=Eimeria tenella TaxID=5802 RepID=U6KSF0_EIMTE|nr:hypothetical protein, conserved [Eimeria tenella]CDJ39304.1 hypothetical protein, conserved [Eimeria tenella]|eukprot:XP_013230059.1 hypothetical protein, conserved [Eimeria tenella]